jgi:hypothetical protein
MADIKHLDLPQPPESNRILIEELRRIIRLAYKHEFEWLDLDALIVKGDKNQYLDFSWPHFDK